MSPDRERGKPKLKPSSASQVSSFSHLERHSHKQLSQPEREKPGDQQLWLRFATFMAVQVAQTSV